MSEQSEQPREPLSDEQVAELYRLIHDWRHDATIALLTEDNKRLRAELAARDVPAEVRQHYEDIDSYIASFSPEERAALEQASADMNIILDLQSKLDKALSIVRAVAEATTTWTGESEYLAISALRYPGRETSRQLRDKARALLADSDVGKAASDE